MTLTKNFRLKNFHSKPGSLEGEGFFNRIAEKNIFIGKPDGRTLAGRINRKIKSSSLTGRTMPTIFLIVSSMPLKRSAATLAGALNLPLQIIDFAAMKDPIGKYRNLNDALQAVAKKPNAIIDLEGFDQADPHQFHMIMTAIGDRNHAFYDGTTGNFMDKTFIVTVHPKSPLGQLAIESRIPETPPPGPQPKSALAPKAI